MLSFNPIMVDNFAAFFNCTAGGSGVRLYDSPDLRMFAAKCTLPYIYFVFKCHVLYFGIKKEWLEKSWNTLSLAANILKAIHFSSVGSELLVFCLVQRGSSVSCLVRRDLHRRSAY